MQSKKESSSGGFLIKFDGKKADRCYSCRFDYDEWQYAVNNAGAKPLPDGLKKIEVIVE